MEQLISKLRSDLDRALREKRAAESEVEKITKHLPEEGNRMNIAFDELHSKLNSAEKERLEAEQRLEALQSNFKQEQSRYELELFQANETNENNYRRLKRLENELEEANVLCS